MVCHDVSWCDDFFWYGVTWYLIILYDDDLVWENGTIQAYCINFGAIFIPGLYSKIVGGQDSGSDLYQRLKFLDNFSCFDFSSLMERIFFTAAAIYKCCNLFIADDGIFQSFMLLIID